MAYPEEPEYVIRAVRDQKGREADAARQQAQRYIEVTAAAHEKAVADRARLLAVAKYAAAQLVQHEVVSDTRLESTRVIPPPKRKFRDPRPPTLYYPIAEGWMVGQPASEKEHISRPACDPYTGEWPKGYEYKDPEDLYTGRILTPGGDLVNFRGVYRYPAPRSEPDAVTIYRANDKKFNTVQPLEPQPPLSIDAAQKILAGFNAPGLGLGYRGPNIPVLPDNIVERAVAELVVNLVPEG